ncbi:MAG: lysophospholipid acyltransferase family protein, partial [Alphaproteobacteria bacterium]
AASALGAEQRYWLSRPGPVLGLMGLLLYAVNRLIMRGLFRMRVIGACRLPSKGPVLLAPNHSSYLDPFVLAAALGWRQARRTYWAGWSGKMMTGPIMRLFSRVGHVLPVDPDRGPASALSLGAAALGGGAMLIWFPEGRRSPTGMLNPFLPGVGVLIRTTAIPAVPVRIEGTFEALPRGRTIARLSRVRVTFGEPLDPATLEAAGEGDSPEERIASALHAAVARLSGGTGARTRQDETWSSPG